MTHQLITNAEKLTNS